MEVESEMSKISKSKSLLLFKSKLKTKYKFGCVEFRRYISPVGPNFHNKAFYQYYGYEEIELVAETRKSLNNLHFTPTIAKKFGVPKHNPFYSHRMTKKITVRYTYSSTEISTFTNSGKIPEVVDFNIRSSSSKENILKPSKFKPKGFMPEKRGKINENKQFASLSEIKNLNNPLTNVIVSGDINFHNLNFEKDYENARLELKSKKTREREKFQRNRTKQHGRENEPSERKLSTMQAENLKISKISPDDGENIHATRIISNLQTEKNVNTGKIEHYGSETALRYSVQAEKANLKKSIMKHDGGEKIPDKRKVSFKEAGDDVQNISGPSVINRHDIKEHTPGTSKRLYGDQTNAFNDSKSEQRSETSTAERRNEEMRNVHFWRSGYQEICNCYKEFKDLLICFLAVLLQDIPGAVASPPPWPLHLLLNTLKHIYIRNRQIPYMVMKIILYLDQSEVIFYRGDIYEPNLRQLYIQNVLRPLIDAGIHLMRAIPAPLCNTGMVSYIKLLHLAEKMFGPNKKKKENVSETATNVIRTTGRNLSLIKINKK